MGIYRFLFIGKPSHDLISLRWGSTKQIRALSNVLLELSGLLIFTNEECQKLFTQVNPQIIMFFYKTIVYFIIHGHFVVNVSIDVL